MRLATRLLLGTAGVLAASSLALGVRRLARDRTFDRLEHNLLAVPGVPSDVFTPALVAELPEPTRRYLLHAIAPGTPLASAVRLEMTGTMRPSPEGPAVDLRADEVLAPRRGFIWTAQARMGGVPVRVRDHYYRGKGGVGVTLLGLVPLPTSGDADDVARSSHGRLVAEAVWCPIALVHPSVTWEAIDADRARYTLYVDGEAEAVTVHVAPDGSLREVTLERWGDVEGPPARRIPYGFRVDAEGTFGGLTIPTRLVGGWHYGTDRFDEAAAATFAVTDAYFVGH